MYVCYAELKNLSVMKRWILISLGVVCLFTTQSINAQNISINRDGALPHASAILDITATDAGVLIPRMTEASMNAIASPATGLMIFQTDGSQGFKFFNGTGWGPVSSSMYNYTHQINSVAALTANTSWKVIPGTIDTIVLYADAKIMIWANGVVECRSNNDQRMASAEVAIYKDGVLLNGGAYMRVNANNDDKSKAVYSHTPFSLMTVQDLPAGTYVFDMRAKRIATHGESAPPRLGGPATNPRAASMIFQVHYK